MGQVESSRNNRRNKHLNWEERIQIEILQREGLASVQIGERIGRLERTIRRELDRGWITHCTDRYSTKVHKTSPRSVKDAELYE